MRFLQRFSLGVCLPETLLRACFSFCFLLSTNHQRVTGSVPQKKGQLLARFYGASSVFGLDSPVFCAVSRISIGVEQKQARHYQPGRVPCRGNHAPCSENNFLSSFYKLAQDLWDYEPLIPIDEALKGKRKTTNNKGIRTPFSRWQLRRGSTGRNVIWQSSGRPELSSRPEPPLSP